MCKYLRFRVTVISENFQLKFRISWECLHYYIRKCPNYIIVHYRAMPLNVSSADASHVLLISCRALPYLFTISDPLPFNSDLS